MITPENNLTAQPGRKCVVYLNISPHVVWYRSVCQINKGVSAMRGIFSCQMYNRSCTKHVFLWTERENLTCHITTFQKTRTEPWGTNFTKSSNIKWVFGSKAHSKTQIGHEICYILRVFSQMLMAVRLLLACVKRHRSAYFSHQLWWLDVLWTSLIVSVVLYGRFMIVGIHESSLVRHRNSGVEFWGVINQLLQNKYE